MDQVSASCPAILSHHLHLLAQTWIVACLPSSLKERIKSWKDNLSVKGDIWKLPSFLPHFLLTC